MLREYASVFRKILVVSDICLAAGVYLAAYLMGGHVKDLTFHSAYLRLMPFFVMVWTGLFHVLGMHESFRTKPFSEILSIAAETAAFGFAILGSIIFIFKFADVQRAFIFLLFSLAFVVFVAEKAGLAFTLQYIRRKGYNVRHVLVVGTGKRAQHFVDLVSRHSEWGYRIIGLVDEEAKKNEETVAGQKVIGSFDDLAGILHNNVVDHVVFVVPRRWFEKIEPLVRFCEIEGIPASVAVDLYELKLSRARQTDFHGFPLMTFESAPDKVWHLLIKRLADVLISGVALAVLLPFFLIIAVLIRKTSPGSVFFGQTRCGLNGRRFTLYKFRTMVADAEAKLGDLLSHNEMKGPAFKMKDDPRVTGVGKFLRKFSLDEFPQFWNVLKGDMSVVGPRPPLPVEVGHYDNWQRRRLSMRPGLTCLWQIRGRNSISDFDEWMRMDLEYIDTWSLWLDGRIFLKTIPVVLTGCGAH